MVVDSTPDNSPDFSVSSPELQGMNAERLAAMLRFIDRDGRRLGSVLVVRNGCIVVEAYFDPFTRETGHHVYSVTKSIVSLLIGIAIDDGAIRSVDQRVLDFLPEMTDVNRDPRTHAMTVEHLLTMKTGLRWNETKAAYGTPRNVVEQMKCSPDWVRFVLSQPFASRPGQRFAYNSGASHLLSAIIARQTGMSASAYAIKQLFQPLGITSCHWTQDPAGITTGGWGLHLTARDMAKIGQLLLSRGAWSGMQVVAAKWIDESVQKRAVVISKWDPRFRLAVPLWWLLGHDCLPLTQMDYGYHWWIPPVGGFAARGYGGQSICVLPRWNLVVVTAGALGAKGAYLPEKLMRSFVIPSAAMALSTS